MGVAVGVFAAREPALVGHLVLNVLTWPAVEVFLVDGVSVSWYGPPMFRALALVLADGSAGCRS